jgi:D-alanine-D-alanine ligase
MNNTALPQKKKVAVFFGGRSPEHDVSVVSGLQALSAFDTTKYDPFPVYITLDGQWLVGDVLKTRTNYIIRGDDVKRCTPVTLDLNAAGKGGRLIPLKQPFIGHAKPIAFDIAFLGFHGLYGEDGNIQGTFEMANVPYTGARILQSAIFMDKIATKRILNSLDIPTLPYAVLRRPGEGYMIAEKDIKTAMKGLKFPCILKPVHLGSSIGVAKVNSIEEINACLPAIFEFDDAAMLEPFVEHLVEYNVAVSRINGETQTSAIERPKATDELLDFKQKYLSGGGTKTGNKTGATKSEDNTISEGMLSLTRELNPKLTKKMTAQIRDWSVRLFEAIDGTGAPRIDYIGNSKTKEVWFNEVNPIPGSFGYFLWEASKDNPVLFTTLISGLCTEALKENQKRCLPKDPVPKDAYLLKR